MGARQSRTADGSGCDLLFDDIELEYEALFEDLERNRFSSFRKRLSTRHKSRDRQIFALCVNHRQRKTDLTCLELACMQDKRKFVELLLNRGANPCKTNEKHNNYTPIHFAVRNGHADVLRILLRHPTTNPNCEASSLVTPLHIAVRKEDLLCADLLLKHGASASLPNDLGVTAVHLAATRGQRDMVKLMMTEISPPPDIDTSFDRNCVTARHVILQTMPDVCHLPSETKDRPITPSLTSQEKLLWHLKWRLTQGLEIDLENIETDVLVGAADDLLTIAVDGGMRRSASYILKKLNGNRPNLKRAPLAAVLRRDPVVLRALLEADPGSANVDLLIQANDEVGFPSRISNGEEKALECVQMILNVGQLSNKPNRDLRSNHRAQQEQIYRWQIVREALFHGENFKREKCACNRQNS